MEALIEEIPGEPVRDLAVDRAGGDDHARAGVDPQNLSGIGQLAEQRKPGDRLRIDAVIVHETEHPVAEPRFGLQHRGQLAPFRVGPDEHDVAQRRPAGSAAGEDASSDLPFDEHERHADDEQGDERRPGHEEATRSSPRGRRAARRGRTR